jgi:streptogramin lyase
MIRAYLRFRFLAVAAVAISGFSSVARADLIYVDNNIAITAYTPTGSSYASLSQPGSRVLGMAFTPQDVLITADDPITGTGGLFAYASGVPTPFGSIANPLGLAIDSNGNVYVGANGGTSIDELNPDGTVHKVIAAVTDGIHANALAVDTHGDVFEADTSGDIYEYFAGGGRQLFSQTGLDGSTGYGMVFDPLGDLFVTYQGFGGGIDEFDPTGALTSFYSTAANLPSGLAYDSETHKLYMSYWSSTSGVGGGVDVFSTVNGALDVTTQTNFKTFATGQQFSIAYEAPEPGTVLLFAGGLLAVGLHRLRRIGA